MKLLREFIQKGGAALAGAGATALGQPEFAPIASKMAYDVLGSDVAGDLAKKGIKQLVNHQFSFGNKKFSARDIIRKVQGVGEKALSKLSDHQRNILKDVGQKVFSDVKGIATADNPLMAGKQLVKQLKDLDVVNQKYGIQDALGKISKDAIQKYGIPESVVDVAKMSVNKLMDGGNGSKSGLVNRLVVA